MSFKKEDYHFELPEHLIAQKPILQRDSSRLLHLDKETGVVKHLCFSQILDHLNPGDCLVLNNSKVLPARIFGRRDTGAVVEFLLLKEKASEEHHVWECLVKPGKKARVGDHFTFGPTEEPDLLTAVVTGIGDEGSRIVTFKAKGMFIETLERIGTMPLPPYIHEQLDDQSRYQTVYAKETGSAAAPTAGLHFTEELLTAIEAKGVTLAYVTLHVGLGTFRPVKVDNILDHVMHSEYYEISDATADAINRAKLNGHRVITVGTTSTRTIESACDESGKVIAGTGWTDIFIYPGHVFKVIDGLVTNFHLPESTLIMLISALAGRENVLDAYAEAVKEEYRFFSFGDAMLII